jgi:hypothetical protein
MSRPKGALNKKTTALIEKAAELDLDVMGLQFAMIKDLEKSYRGELNRPRNRRSKLWNSVEQRLSEKLDAVSPYLYRRLRDTTVDGPAVAVSTVIRAPEKLSDTKEWLEKYGPKDVTPEKILIESKPQPTVEAFVPALKAANHVSNVIGNVPAQQQIDEARRWAALEQKQDDYHERINRQFLDAYK